MMYNVHQAAEFLGVAPSTLRRWEDEGKLIPLRTEGNHRRYEKSQLVSMKMKRNNEKYTIAYCRVSTSDQKDDLKRQIETVSNYCSAKGYQFKVIEDLGSGLNYKKKGLKELIELISSGDIERIVINYKDRLVRFGFELIEELCNINNVAIEIINLTENKSYEEELVEDVLSVITIFSSKLYGSRSHKTQKIKAENELLFVME